MRRSELIDAIQELRQALTESKLADVLESTRSLGPPESLPSEVFSILLKAVTEYLVRSRSFKPATNELVRVFKLRYLSDPDYWSKLLQRDGFKNSYILHRDINFFINYLPNISALLLSEESKIIDEGRAEGNPAFLGKDLLTVVLIEEKDRFSKPIRLRKMLESVEHLYDSCVTITESQHESLSVIGCDSGSDKSFDFFGAAKVLECVKELIISLWDRVVFYREHKLSERMDLISKSLPIMDQIGDMERQQKIGAEQAELLRRNILAGVNGFIESGATIPELEERSHFNPRLLMSPAPKLLTGLPEIDVDPDTRKSDAQPVSDGSDNLDLNLNGLDETEREELLRLLQKTRTQKKGETEPPEG